jgi:hypothetical protein
MSRALPRFEVGVVELLIHLGKPTTDSPTMKVIVPAKDRVQAAQKGLKAVVKKTEKPEWILRVRTVEEIKPITTITTIPQSEIPKDAVPVVPVETKETLATVETQVS